MHTQLPEPDRARCHQHRSACAVTKRGIAQCRGPDSVWGKGGGSPGTEVDMGW